MHRLHTLSLMVVLLIAVLAGAATIRKNRHIRAMARELHATYPAATLQDVYKTCYQDFWGAEHLVPDSAVAARYLQEEMVLATTDSSLMPDMEPCGFRQNYVRVSLNMVVEGRMSEEELLNAFLNASEDRPKLPLRQPRLWKLEWKKIARLALDEVPEWHDAEMENDLQEAADQTAAVRHSESFRQTYHPHYRIIRK